MGGAAWRWWDCERPRAHMDLQVGSCPFKSLDFRGPWSQELGASLKAGGVLGHPWLSSC